MIVCAGAYHSPALLIRSGIGPASDIAALGRSVTMDLPGVGNNLADHLWVAIELPCVTPQGDPPIFQVVAGACREFGAAGVPQPIRRISSSWCADHTGLRTATDACSPRR